MVEGSNLFDFFNDPDNSYLDPYFYYQPSKKESSDQVDNLEIVLQDPNAKHYPIIQFLTKHKDALRLYLELSEEYRDKSVIEMIENHSYYIEQVKGHYQDISSFTPISRKDIILLMLELVCEDFYLAVSENRI